MSYGQAAMLLSLGKKGFRAMQPNSSSKAQLFTLNFVMLILTLATVEQCSFMFLVHMWGLIMDGNAQMLLKGVYLSAWRVESLFYLTQPWPEDGFL